MALDFHCLELAFNLASMEFSELNLISISDFSCDLLQIDDGFLNQICKIVFNNLSVLLWHRISNPIALNYFNLCAVTLNELPDLIVSTKLLLNFLIVFLVVFKLVKKYFFFDLLVFLHLFLLVFSGMRCFRYEVGRRFDLFSRCFW